jgi:hypothetical protein
MEGARAVNAEITSETRADRFEGAAVLRRRPHPLTRDPALQLGVPDDALGFRPARDDVFHVVVRSGTGPVETYTAGAAWLERVQTSWWFILDEAPS